MILPSRNQERGIQGFMAQVAKLAYRKATVKSRNGYGKIFRSASNILEEKEMHLYNITVRDEDGTISAQQATAPSLRLAARGRDARLELLRVQRIDPSTGEVLEFAIRYHT
jgi:hypothetical protein